MQDTERPSDSAVLRRADRHARGRSRGLPPVAPFVLIGLLIVAVLAWLVLRDRSAQPSEMTEQVLEEVGIPEAPPAPRAAPAAGGWRPLPAAPLPLRSEQAAAWADGELLVWGGADEDGVGRRTFFADGAALDLATGAWRLLADAPLEPRTDHLAVWAEDELLVWGGTGRTGLLDDGAAYDPDVDDWTALPAAPLSPRADPTAVWTGTELVVLGGRDNGGPLLEGAAYDPATGDWRSLEALPPEFGGAAQLGAVWDGAGLVVWTGDRGGLGTTSLARADGAVGPWALLPSPPADDLGLAVLTGEGGTLSGLRVSPDGTRGELATLPLGAPAWTAVAAPATIADPWGALGAVTPDALVFAGPDGSGLVHRPGDGSWQEIPPAEALTLGVGALVLTGQDILVVDGIPDDGASGAAWRLGDAT